MICFLNNSCELRMNWFNAVVARAKGDVHKEMPPLPQCGECDSLQTQVFCLHIIVHPLPYMFGGYRGGSKKAFMEAFERTKKDWPYPFSDDEDSLSVIMGSGEKENGRSQ